MMARKKLLKWNRRHKNVKSEYKIAVVANMSAGKTTFINSMFADDILPAYSKATTDCPVYIYSDDDPSNDKAIISFLDGKKDIVLSKNEVKKELKLYAQKDSEKLDEKYKSVKKIDLHWDFQTLQNSDESDLNFIIIDTPGPNNTDGFKEKHSKITKDIIANEADMILYLFDYGQIDANLEATNENIWGLIQKRRQKNKKFEVFFIINKIDMAFEDNRKLSKVGDSKNKTEFNKNIKEYWLYHENKAVEKIKNAAIKYGFKNPKVFTASSEYQKLLRMKKISWDDEDRLDVLKRLFRRMFKKSWEKELIKYVKGNIIENETMLHLKNIEEKRRKAK